MNTNGKQARRTPKRTRSYEQPSNNTKIIIGGLATVIGSYFLLAWAVMLLLGNLAIATGWPVAISFRATVLIGAIFYLIVVMFNTISIPFRRE